MGVLTIYNAKEDKIWISGNTNLRALSNRMRFVLESGQCEIKSLQEDWNRLGQNAFIIEDSRIILFEENKIINYKKAVRIAENKLKEELKKSKIIYE